MTQAHVLFFTAVAFVLGACAHAEGSTAQVAAAVALEQSPSNGQTFTFCPAPAQGSTVHLTNAAWLAFIAANEYVHAKTYGPMLGKLGFHNPNMPDDLMWEECATDLRELRKVQAAHEAELSRALGTPAIRTIARSLIPPAGEKWGSCVRPVLESDTLPVDVFPAVAFQKDLVQTVHRDRYLQFFSAGKVTDGGKRFEDASTQVVFARHNELPVVIISFRGTEPSQAADLAADLKLWKTPLKDRGWPEEWGSVHSGFLQAFESVEPLLLDKLREVPDGAKIWITGHSLGAGLATLLTARLLRDDDRSHQVAGLYTFGSPRVGDHRFAAQFTASAKGHNVQVVRFRNARDAVTAAPGKSFDYEHVGTLAWIHDGKLDVGLEADPPHGMASLADHGSVGYYKLLSGFAKSGAFPELQRCGD